MQIQPVDYAVYGLNLVAAIIAVQILGTTHPVLLFCLALLILVGGLPHGALDYFILKQIYRGQAFVASLFVYVGIAVLNLGIWTVFPNLIFPVFLAYSVYHFGSSDQPRTPLHNQIAWGLAIIGLPCLLAPADTHTYFNLFMSPTESANVIYGLSALCLVALGVGVVDHRDRRNRWITLLVYGSILSFANVLCAFTFYFVFVHSKIHERAWMAYVPRKDFHILRGLTLIVVSGVVGLTAFFAHAGQFPTVDQPLYLFIRNIFWVLGSLTVSHMALAWMTSRSKQIRPIYSDHGSRTASRSTTTSHGVTLPLNKIPN